MKNNKDVDSLSHTTWRCQYHVVFAPKYRRMVIYGQIKKDIGQILRKLCEQKDIEIIEAEACHETGMQLADPFVAPYSAKSGI